MSLQALDRTFRNLVLCLVLLLSGLAPASADTAAASLQGFLPKTAPSDFFPGADRFGPQQGSPPMAPVYAGDTLKGFVYLNTDFTNATAIRASPSACWSGSIRKA